MATSNNAPNSGNVKGMYHIVLGLMFAAAGGVLFYTEYTGGQKMFFENAYFNYGAAVLIIAYGLFRIYRGYRIVTGKQKSW